MGAMALIDVRLPTESWSILAERSMGRGKGLGAAGFPSNRADRSPLACAGVGGVETLQGHLAHDKTKTHPPRTLPWAYF